MRRLAIAALLLLTACAAPARADWLADAWPPDTITETSPAITLNAQLGAIIVVAPATLSAARHAGLSTEAAAKALLERYGELCSDVIDLQQPHQGLAVTLSLARPVIPGLVITDDEEAHFTIDYVPQRQAHCIAPDVPTS